MLEIEFEEPAKATCQCCGQEVISLTRFVYQNGDAFSVYYLKFTKGHQPKVAYGLISLGEWEKKAKPQNRVAFPFKIWTNESHYQVGLTDASESPWKKKDDITFLGRLLDREESLQHAWIQDVFHITDHIVADDLVVISYFSD